MSVLNSQIDAARKAAHSVLGQSELSRQQTGNYAAGLADLADRHHDALSEKMPSIEAAASATLDNPDASDEEKEDTYRALLSAKDGQARMTQAANLGRYLKLVSTDGREA